jgi:hypothetical protein
MFMGRDQIFWGGSAISMFLDGAMWMSTGQQVYRIPQVERSSLDNRSRVLYTVNWLMLKLRSAVRISALRFHGIRQWRKVEFGVSSEP